MEFVCGICQTTSSDKTKCNFCINTCLHNNTPEIHGILQPKPDKSKLPEFHYLDVFATPLYNDEDSNTRSPDDYQARANIRQNLKTVFCHLTMKSQLIRSAKNILLM